MPQHISIFVMLFHFVWFCFCYDALCCVVSCMSCYVGSCCVMSCFVMGLHDALCNGLSPLPEILLKYKNPNFIAVAEHLQAVEKSILCQILSVDSRAFTRCKRFHECRRR